MQKAQPACGGTSSAWRGRPLKMLAVVGLLAALFLGPALLQSGSGLGPTVEEDLDRVSPVSEGPLQERSSAQPEAEQSASAPEPGATSHHREPIRELSLEPGSPAAGQSVTLELRLNYWLEAREAEAVVSAWLTRPATPQGRRGGRWFSRTLRAVKVPGLDTLRVPLSFPHAGDWEVSLRLAHPRLESDVRAQERVRVSEAPEPGSRVLPGLESGPVLYAHSWHGEASWLHVLDAVRGTEIASLAVAHAADLLAPPESDLLLIAQCQAECETSELRVLERSTGTLLHRETVEGRARLLGGTPDGGRIVLFQEEEQRLRGTFRTYLPTEGRLADVAVPKRQGCTIERAQVTRDGRQAFVLCGYAGTQLERGRTAILAIDFERGSVERKAELEGRGASASTLHLAPEGDRLYLTDLEAGEVLALDASSGRVLAAARFGSEHEARLQDRILDWLAPRAAAKVTFQPETATALSPDGSRLYVVGGSVHHRQEGVADGIFVVDTETLETVARLTPKVAYMGLSLSADGSRLFALERSFADQDEGRIRVFETSTLEPAGSLVTPDLGFTPFLAYAAPPGWTWLPTEPLVMTFDGNPVAVDLNSGERRPLRAWTDRMLRLRFLPARPTWLSDREAALSFEALEGEEPSARLIFPVPQDACRGCVVYETAVGPDGEILLATAAKRPEAWEVALHAFDGLELERLWSRTLASAREREVWLQLLVDAEGRQAHVAVHSVDGQGVRLPQHVLASIDLREPDRTAAVKVPRDGDCYDDRQWTPAGSLLVQAGCVSSAAQQVLVRALDPWSGELTTWEVPMEPPPQFLHLSLAAHGPRVYLAHPTGTQIAALDLERGTVRTVSLDRSARLLERLYRLLMPVAEAKMTPQASLLISPDGKTLYLSRWMESAPYDMEGHGLWVLDAETLTVRDRWAPDVEVWSMRLSGDGRFP